MPLRVPLALMLSGALLVGLWTIVEAHGLEPLSLLDPQTLLRPNLLASMGTSGVRGRFCRRGARVLVLLAAVVSKAQAPRCRCYHPVSGGLSRKWGTRRTLGGYHRSLLAARLCFSMGAENRRAALLLSAFMLVAGFAVTQTSSHAQFRMGRISAAVQGEDPNVSHRMILWSVATKAIVERTADGFMEPTRSPTSLGP